LNYYEAMYILDPSLSDDRLRELVDSISSELADKGEVFGVDVLGKKQLAHPIKKATDGQYVVIYFSIDPGEIEGLRSRYSLNASVLRVMILRRREEEIRKIKEKLGAKSEPKDDLPKEPLPVDERVEEPSAEAPADANAEEPVAESGEEAPVDDEPAASDAETERA
jgi:small subunit ribosomal protein S6